MFLCITMLSLLFNLTISFAEQDLTVTKEQFRIEFCADNKLKSSKKIVSICDGILLKMFSDGSKQVIDAIRVEDVDPNLNKYYKIKRKDFQQDNEYITFNYEIVEDVTGVTPIPVITPDVASENVDEASVTKKSKNKKKKTPELIIPFYKSVYQKVVGEKNQLRAFEMTAQLPEVKGKQWGFVNFLARDLNSVSTSESSFVAKMFNSLVALSKSGEIKNLELTKESVGADDITRVTVSDDSVKIVCQLNESYPVIPPSIGEPKNAKIKVYSCDLYGKKSIASRSGDLNSVQATLYRALRVSYLGGVTDVVREENDVLSLQGDKSMITLKCQSNLKVSESNKKFSCSFTK